MAEQFMISESWLIVVFLVIFTIANYGIIRNLRINTISFIESKSRGKVENKTITRVYSVVFFLLYIGISLILIENFLNILILNKSIYLNMIHVQSLHLKEIIYKLKQFIVVMMPINYGIILFNSFKRDKDIVELLQETDRRIITPIVVIIAALTIIAMI